MQTNTFPKVTAVTGVWKPSTLWKSKDHLLMAFIYSEEEIDLIPSFLVSIMRLLIAPHWAIQIKWYMQNT